MHKIQQKKLKNNPWLEANVKKIWWTIKSSPNETVNTETPKGETTPWSEWDYQDNSPERMMQMANNLEQMYLTNPWLFANEKAFRDFFINWVNRTPEQEAFLMDYFKNRQIYNEYDWYTAEKVWDMYAHWQCPQSYLNYLKNSNPDRYNEVMDYKDQTEKWIMNESNYSSILEQAWFSADSNNLKRQTWEWIWLDTDNNWIDDRREHYASEEEKKLWELDSSYDAEILKLNNAMKDLQSDLTEQYPDADLSTIMLLTSDRWNKIQKALDTLSVNKTKVQWTIAYMQKEREMANKAGSDSIAQLQKNLWMYYDYSPEWMSELAQAQYAANNPSLTAAENWTETEKRMALDSALSGYYEKYWSIIQRPKEQVISDVIEYASKNWVSLSQALEDNFLSYLRQKPWYNALANWQTTASDKYNWSSYEWPDWKKHILRMNETTWQWEELDIWDAISDMADLDWLQSKNRDTRKQALFNLAQQADNPQVQAELIAAAMEWNYAGTCWAYANDINYAITWDKNWIFGNDVKQKEWVCDNTEWDNIQAWDFVVFNYQNIPWVSRNTVPSWLWNTDLETWQDMYDHWHVWYVTWVDAQWNITMTHTKSQIAQTSTFGKNTKLWQALYGSYTPVGWYDKSIPNSIYKAVWDAAEKWDIDKLESLAKQYWYSDYNTLIRQYERQYQDSILPVAEWLLQKIDQLIASTQNTSKLERAATLKWEWSYVNSEAHSAYQSLLNDYALDKLSSMTVKLSPMSDTDVKIVASATTPFMNEWYMYANDNYFRDLQNIRDSIISRSAVLQKKYWDTNAWNWQKQYYDWTTQRFTSTKPRWVLWGN